ncbi:hypothetical protein PAEPH01_1710 [Pancytospora epiphaga]|nr:hypothetical protein PAEPH01_1710 [Pancytospora epiphaga]
MVTVTVYNKNRTRELVISTNDCETVADVKRMLELESSDVLQIVFQNEILEDSTVLSTLGEDVELVISESIKFTEINGGNMPNYENQLITEQTIEPKLSSDLISRITPGCYEDNEQSPLQNEPTFKNCSSEQFVLNGKTYKIVRRTKRITLKSVMEKLEALFTPALLFQCLMLLFVLHSNNIFILVLLLGIRCLRLLSNFVRTQQLWKYIKGERLQAVFMFFASLFLLDHQLFFNVTTENLINSDE